MAMWKRLIPYWALGAGLLIAMYAWRVHVDANPVALVLPGAKMSTVLSAADARSRRWSLSDAFDVTPSGLILVQSGRAIFNAVTGEPILREQHLDLADFVALGDGIVSVCGGSLCAYSAEGSLEPVMKLPAERMFLGSAGQPDEFYCYHNSSAGADVYLIRGGGAYLKLFHVEGPIFAIAGVVGRVFLAVSNKIVTWKPGEDPSVVVDLKQEAPVTSLAIDSSTGLLFFSVGEGVFAFAEKRVSPVLIGVTGDLRFSNGVLFVKDRTQRAILAVSGMSQAVVADWRKSSSSP